MKYLKCHAKLVKSFCFLHMLLYNFFGFFLCKILLIFSGFVFRHKDDEYIKVLHRPSIVFSLIAIYKHFLYNLIINTNIF